VPVTEPPFPAHTDVPAQEDGGATILEIGQQPDAWREVAGGADAQAARFLSRIAFRHTPVENCGGGRRCVPFARWEQAWRDMRGG